MLEDPIIIIWRQIFIFIFIFRNRNRNRINMLIYIYRFVDLLVGHEGASTSSNWLVQGKYSSSPDDRGYLANWYRTFAFQFPRRLVVVGIIE